MLLGSSLLLLRDGLDINGSFLKSCLKQCKKQYFQNVLHPSGRPSVDQSVTQNQIIIHLNINVTPATHINLIVLHSLGKRCRYGYFIYVNTIKIINTMIVRIIHTVHCSRQESASLY